MKASRKDKFICIVTALWAVTNITVYFLFDIDHVLYSNLAYIIFLVCVLLCKPAMRWLNEK